VKTSSRLFFSANKTTNMK